MFKRGLIEGDAARLAGEVLRWSLSCSLSIAVLGTQLSHLSFSLCTSYFPASSRGLVPIPLRVLTGTISGYDLPCLPAVYPPSSNQSLDVLVHNSRGRSMPSSMCFPQAVTSYGAGAAELKCGH